MEINERGFLFLGTGSSSSIPNLSHLPIGNRNNWEKKELKKEDLEEITKYLEKLVEDGMENYADLENKYLKKLYENEKNIKCYTCVDALHEGSKNRRNNISLLLKSNKSYVLIDCGKTFRASLLFNRSFLDFNNHFLEKVLISHSHADAVAGMDDLRDLQKFDKIKRKSSFCYVPKCVIKMYLNDICYEHLNKCYKYMTHKRYEFYLSKIPAIDYYVLKRDMYNRILKDEEVKIYINSKETNNISNVNVNDEVKNEKENLFLDKKEKLLEELSPNEATNIHNDTNSIKIIDNEQPKEISNIINYTVTDEYGFAYTYFDENIRIRFIPVEHGENYVCIGYIIGNKNKLLYISDCSNVSGYTLNYIKKCSPISILIIDALFFRKKHFSHFSLYESVKLALEIKPKRVYFIGMCCELEHNITNMFLQKLSEKMYPDISFALAYDGLFVPFDF